MDTRSESAARGLVLLGDAVLVAVAMCAAYGAHAWLRPYVPQMRALPAIGEYGTVAYLALPLWIVLVAVTGLHRVFESSWSRWELATRLARMHVLGTTGLVFALFVTQSTLNRSVVVVFVLSSFGLLFAERTVLSAYARHQRASGRATKRLLFVGDPGAALDRFVAHASRVEFPPKLVGRLGAASPGEGAETVAHLGDLAALAAIVGREPIDEVVFFPPCDDPRSMRDALEACSTVGVPASFVLDTEPLGGITPQVRREHEAALLTFELSAKSPLALAVKHAIDAFAAALILALVAPLLLVVALLIVVTMGRPVLFVQKRAGLRGREFSMFKLRTMVRDAEAQKAALAERNEMSGPVFKIGDDPRVTRLGKFLRKSSIDELPQLINVLTGAMSLVGPRPLPVAEQQGIVGWHRRRLSVKPGITGLWQIGGRSNIDFEDWMRLDLRYVDEWSLALDAKILLSTVPVVLLGRGAR